MVYKLNFYTQYNQFYIADKSSPKDSGRDHFWTIEAYNERLAIGDGILGVGTQCYGPIKGELNILTKSNDNLEFIKNDHIVEGDISIKSGVMQIFNCPVSEIELEVKLNPGNFRIRVYYSNLDSVIGDEGEDYYKIEVWPIEKIRERKVLKQYLDH